MFDVPRMIYDLLSAQLSNSTVLLMESEGRFNAFGDSASKLNSVGIPSTLNGSFRKVELEQCDLEMTAERLRAKGFKLGLAKVSKNALSSSLYQVLEFS